MLHQKTKEHLNLEISVTDQTSWCSIDMVSKTWSEKENRTRQASQNWAEVYCTVTTAYMAACEHVYIRQTDRCYSKHRKEPTYL